MKMQFRIQTKINGKFLRIISLVIAAGILAAPQASNSQSAAAEGVLVSVDLPVAGEPRAVTGIALGNSLEMISKVSLKRFSAGTLTASFKAPAQAKAVLAMAEMADGTTIFGDTRLIDAAKDLPSLASIPDGSISGVLKADPSQRGLMQSLVEIRTARRDMLKNRLRAAMAVTTPEKIAKLEELFGLTRPTALTIELSPTEIIDRLNRLTSAIRAYRITRLAMKASETKN